MWLAKGKEQILKCYETARLRAGSMFTSLCYLSETLTYCFKQEVMRLGHNHDPDSQFLNLIWCADITELSHCQLPLLPLQNWHSCREKKNHYVQMIHICLHKCVCVSVCLSETGERAAAPDATGIRTKIYPQHIHAHRASTYTLYIHVHKCLHADRQI